MNWVKAQIRRGDAGGVWQLLGRRLAMLRGSWQFSGGALASDLGRRFDAIVELFEQVRPWSESSSSRLFLQWFEWSEELSRAWPIAAPEQWGTVLQLDQNRVVQSSVVLATVGHLAADETPGTERLSSLSREELEFWNALPLPPGLPGSDASDCYLHRAVDPAAFGQLQELAGRINALAEDVADSWPIGAPATRPRSVTAAVIRQFGNALSCLEQGCPVPDHLLLRPLDSLARSASSVAEVAVIGQYAVDAQGILPSLRIVAECSAEGSDVGSSASLHATPLHATPLQRLAEAARNLQRTEAGDRIRVVIRILEAVDDATRQPSMSDLLDCLLLVDDIAAADPQQALPAIVDVQDALREVLFSAPGAGPYRILADNLHGCPRREYAEQVDALPGVVHSSNFPPDTIVDVCRPGYIFQPKSAPPVVIRKAVVRVSG